ncbi:ATP-binding protein [Limnohabitans sp. WS1]|uniref:ATP-binding protein n=1 Tax=Limnohabitans sp. WS1 TaxID=1100726 RepID=UPI000D3AFC03|nr:ATP-binding protein [Limnohabitans sp. WS1]PUE14439.1 ATPase [Limnohabitans sp. WS1]
MFKRHLQALLSEELQFSPAVALLGPRQVGKTTLALEVARNMPHVYLDLESERDRGKLAQPELYLESHLDKLVILDEVHRAPGLFPVLRGLIDQARRSGRASGQYLLLGSASLDVLHQSGETLAGRIAYLELGPLNVLETGQSALDALWLRGGFPQSLTTPSDARSLRWRENFIRTYLERDIPQFGPRIAAETLRRFWTMLAHHQGGLLNVAQLARNLGVDVKTAQSYTDLLCDLLLVRRLAPWHTNTGKRLVKAPKVYVRDSGLVHALLNIESKESLLSHMVVGASWEGYCIETLLACAPAGVTGYFYRTSGGAEIDLLLVWPGGDLWAIEIKRSSAPKVERGFHSACDDLKPSHKWVVYPGQETYPLAADIQAISLHGLCEKLALNRS